MLTVLLLHALLAVSQTRTISGQIRDEKGNPVPFASIRIKGQGSGTAADANGAFTMQLPAGAILQVSAAGFDNLETKPGPSPTLTINLQAQNTMREVVVTALGIRRSKNSLPYSAQQVSGDDVSRTRGSNFVSSLSGKVAGLEIRQNNALGASTNVVLRGFKSLTGNNQALFVIDGVPVDNSNNNTPNQVQGRGGYDYGNAAADINPDDIESLNVLKGAAATALYGSRASNGVVMITTKKGGRGIGVTINSGMTFGSIDKSTFAKYQSEYGGGYGQYYEDPSGFFLYRDINGDGIKDLVDPTSEDASYGGAFDAGKMVYQWDAFDPTSPNYGKPRPWVAAANGPVTYFESPASNNNSITIDGGSDKGWFKLGYTRTDEKGILPNSEIKKDLVNFGSSYNLTSKLTATATINFSKINGLGRYGSGYDSKNPANNFRQWWQVNNDVQELKEAYFRTKKNVTWNWTDPTDLTPIYWDNPYWVRYENYETDSRSRYFGTVSLSYKITDWLDVLGRASLDSYDEIQEERIAIGSTDVSKYNRFTRSFRENNYDLLANVNRNLSDHLNLKALVGINIRRTYINSITASTNGGLSVPRIYSLSNTKSPLQAPNEDVSTLGVDGAFASASLAYNEYLFLDLTGRRDKSSSLPEQNNTYYYPSASLGFLFSKLLINTSWLSYGKVRVNYAQVGNSAPTRSLLDYYNINTAFGDAAMTTTALTKNNPDLRPEKTKSYEAGVELAFLKNRIGLDVTYYSQQSIDQIIPAPVSNATGYNAKFINAGRIDNKGLEVSLNGSPFKTRDFSWTIALNWSRNRNKVVDLGGEINNLLLGSFQGGVSINAALSEPYGTIRGSDFIYTNGQRTVGSNGRYLITAASNNVIGNTNPDWIGGIYNTFKYKDITLGFLIDVRQGGDLFSLDMYYGLATGLYPETAGLNDLGKPLRGVPANGGGIIRPGVTADGKVNTIRVNTVNYGAYGYRYSPAAAFIYDASYVKLREATITYSVPAQTMTRLAPLKGIDFSVIGRNLWIMHKNLPYADPEDGVSAGNLQGYQVGAYPTTRSIGFNVKLRF